ncbi:hypothetical protein FZC83_01860 [Rossellomorea marisflavi]|uniref:Uncharacterized protein n=1 Tax=Rossellomorea marisflavi TaxID=189381 RepID=A0A5D4S193_9BACI|nr:hypothetical protein [Rossellomorea marisflavi]TYS56341.1 hypothetical protein FZC83_01860 [Rossellomorea marisflavi]
MARVGMDLAQFNKFMKRCSQDFRVRYITPTIHPGFKKIVSIIIHTNDESKEFTITNNPDENFNLTVEVNKYLDEMKSEGSVGTVFV